jgi:hypothetical protein
MKTLSLAMLALAAMSASAIAGPQMHNGVIADQVANAPPDQSDQDGKAPSPKESTSKKLSDQKGVLHPPPTGDHSVIKPPQAEPNSAAVIPPPGTPGGDQSVQPK